MESTTLRLFRPLFISHPQSNDNLSEIDNRLEKVVTLAIVSTLMKVNKNTLEDVQSKLHQEYRCGIQDCVAHPEYLDKVLKDQFGTAYHEIVLDVNMYLIDLLEANNRSFNLN